MSPCIRNLRVAIIHGLYFDRGRLVLVRLLMKLMQYSLDMTCVTLELGTFPPSLALDLLFTMDYDRLSHVLGKVDLISGFV